MKKYIQPMSEAVAFDVEAHLLSGSDLKIPSVHDDVAGGEGMDEGFDEQYTNKENGFWE